MDRLQSVASSLSSRVNGNVRFWVSQIPWLNTGTISVQIGKGTSSEGCLLVTKKKPLPSTAGWCLQRDAETVIPASWWSLTVIAVNGSLTVRRPGHTCRVQQLCGGRGKKHNKQKWWWCSMNQCCHSQKWDFWPTSHFCAVTSSCIKLILMAHTSGHKHFCFKYISHLLKVMHAPDFSLCQVQCAKTG